MDDTRNGKEKVGCVSFYHVTVVCVQSHLVIRWVEQLRAADSGDGTNCATIGVSEIKL